MNLDAMKSYLRKFMQERDWEQFHNPKNLTMALSVEASELVEIFQWKTAEQSLEKNLSEEDKKKIREEMADILCYLIQVSDKLEIDLEKIFWDKVKLNEAKYPVELAKGNCLKYSEL